MRRQAPGQPNGPIFVLRPSLSSSVGACGAVISCPSSLSRRNCELPPWACRSETAGMDALLAVCAGLASGLTCARSSVQTRSLLDVATVMCAKGLDLAAACKQNRHLRASSFWRPGIWRDGEKRGRSLAGFASEIATRCLGSGSVFLVVRFSQEIPWLSALAWCQQYVTVECYNVLAPASASINTACVVNASTRRI